MSGTPISLSVGTSAMVTGLVAGHRHDLHLPGLEQRNMLSGGPIWMWMRPELTLAGWSRSTPTSNGSGETRVTRIIIGA
jgi:hypothetical protein